MFSVLSASKIIDQISIQLFSNSTIDRRCACWRFIVKAEVETSRRGIEPHLVGATILHAHIRNGRLRWPVSDEIYRLSDT
ncbi:hypothetical protein MJL33_31010, partial [Salmonella enterica subsp. enterica serovar Kentucky]|nr:hypothetical protein [Salmonella enterica subsp. enterica serovar Kentucky]